MNDHRPLAGNRIRLTPLLAFITHRALENRTPFGRNLSRAIPRYSPPNTPNTYQLIWPSEGLKLFEEIEVRS